VGPSHLQGEHRSTPVRVRVDKKGRLSIPRATRVELDGPPGDVFFLQVDGAVLRLVKAENPFEALAEHALREHAAGRTVALRDLADEFAVVLDPADA